MKTKTNTVSNPLPFLTFLLLTLALAIYASAAQAEVDKTNPYASGHRFKPYFSSTTSMLQDTGDREKDYKAPQDNEAEADDGKKRHRRNHGRDINQIIIWNNSRNVYDYGNNSTIIVRINETDRARIRSYLREDYYERHCPPGLRHKRFACQPPGQVQQNFMIGRILTADIPAAQPPQDLMAILGPTPHDTYYVQVGSDILLLAEDTNVILDAVQLDSAF